MSRPPCSKVSTGSRQEVILVARRTPSFNSCSTSVFGKIGHSSDLRARVPHFLGMPPAVGLMRLAPLVHQSGSVPRRNSARACANWSVAHRLRNSTAKPGRRARSKCCRRLRRTTAITPARSSPFANYLVAGLLHPAALPANRRAPCPSAGRASDCPVSGLLVGAGAPPYN
jgi:hypothetical protein